MRKYSVSVAYEGSIYIEVEAKDEDDACEIAEQKVMEMNDKKFLHELEPQHAETNVIEEIIE